MECFILIGLSSLILGCTNALLWQGKRENRQTDTYYGSYNYGCECGKNNLYWAHTRIIGGREAYENEFPWMAGIISINRSRMICGASIISDRYVLTAAHCIPYGFDKNDLKVAVNIHNSCKWDAKTTIFSAEKIVPHPRYNKKTNFADIMLIKLVMKLTFNEFIKPICLPETGFDVVSRFGGHLVSALGWGLSEDISLFSINCGLRVVDLMLYKKRECPTKLKFIICAGHMTISRGTCGGDSGGPLQLVKNNRHILIGITSSGYICANVDDPDLYTDVGSMVPWILKETRDDSRYCRNW